MPVKKSRIEKPNTTALSSKPGLKEYLGEIEKKAYEIYLERQKKGIPGNDMADWLNAEKMVKINFRMDNL